MFWKPAKTFGLIIGFFILLSIAGVLMFLLHSVLTQDPGPSAYLTGLLLVLGAPLLALWSYWYFGLVTMRYYLDRNALVIACGAIRHIVPMDAIEAVVSGADAPLADGFRGVGWPGCLMGTARTVDHRPLTVYSTEPHERQHIAINESLCYGISPRRTEEFLGEWAVLKALAPLRSVRQERAYIPLAALPIWRDRTFWAGIVLALLASVALFGLISSQFDALPDRLPLYLSPQREAFRIVGKSEMYLFPAIGTVLVVANGTVGLLVHRRERLAAQLLAAMAASLQAPLWVVALSVLGR